MTRFFSNTGNVSDLEKAIQAFDNAIRLTREDAADIAIYLTNLGAALSERYVRTKEEEDIKRSLLVLERVQTIKANSKMQKTAQVQIAISLLILSDYRRSWTNKPLSRNIEKNTSQSFLGTLKDIFNVHTHWHWA